MCSTISTRWNGMRRAGKKKKLNFQLIIDSTLCRSRCTSGLIYYVNDANTETNGLRKYCKRKRISQNERILQLRASFPHQHTHFAQIRVAHFSHTREEKNNNAKYAMHVKCACLSLLKYSLFFCVLR